MLKCKTVDSFRVSLVKGVLMLPGRSRWLWDANDAADECVCPCRRGFCDVGHKWQLRQGSVGSRPVVTKPQHHQEPGSAGGASCCGTMQVISPLPLCNAVKTRHSDKSVLCAAGMHCRAFLMRCAWWMLWTRVIRLICPWWSARTWGWRWPSCTAGLWRTTASVCSWTQTPWWENTEQRRLCNTSESQNFTDWTDASDVCLKMSRFYQT